jgi:hypothetical protein
MNTIYRKTAKGIAEIETRAHRLLPRLRSALILVDGKKSDDELVTMVLAEPEATLASLLADGFIEVIATLAERPAERKPAAPAAPANPVSAAVLPAGKTFEALRREVVRQLTDLLGPAAETVAIKIERAKSLAELQPLLVQAVQTVRSMRGQAAADAFEARYLRPQ